MNYSDEELDAIRTRSEEALASEPRISSANYSAGMLNFKLTGSVPQGVTISVPAASISFLAGATEGQLAAMKITATGNAIHWTELDVQTSTIAWLEILTGLRTLKSVGQKGGSVRSEAKAVAVRANGAKGGRPRKRLVNA